MNRSVSYVANIVSILAWGGCIPTVDTSVTVASLTVNKMGNGGGTSVTLKSPAGMSYGTVTVDQGAQFLATNVCSAASIFGLAGTATCAVAGGSCSTPGTSAVVSTNTVLQSTASRNIGTAQISQLQETTTYAGSAGNPPLSNLPTNYREIVDVNLDDNGNGPSTPANSQYAPRPQKACGASGTITERIADCASSAKNGTNATWVGSLKGNAGQGTWKLVFDSGQAVAGTCNPALTSTDCYEVWQDTRTGLLWSSSVTRYSFAGYGLNHCLASGNSQNVSTNCSVGGPKQYTGTPGSACSESAETGGVQAIPGICINGTSFTSVACGVAGSTWYPNNLTLTAAAENYNPGNYSIAKGYMGALSSTKVRWRLPTYSDYHQAEIDGLALVMPDLGVPGNTNNRANDGSLGTLSPYYEWIATVLSFNRDNAWTFDTIDSGIEYDSRSNQNVVRCIGR
jgi:hypothetical protein